ncbi:glycine--tRNA ligase [bacterium]|nr:MAG: glycine--tRNA ligase [bacterium]
MTINNNKQLNLESIASFCKQNAFVFPSSEIYGGFAAVYDYGHYGYLFANNIKNAWMKSMIQDREDIVALDSGIFMHPITWKASGHVDGFNDPQIDCKTCKARYRADHILEEFGVSADKQPLEFINAELDKLKSEGKLKCANCGNKDFTEAKVFSLMVKTNLGSPTDTLSEENVVYMRPETCGGIYLEYKNVLTSQSMKLPFGIAQIGKAFRNEIVARQFIFRTREFEQMEMQYFHNPKDTKELYEDWKQVRWNWFKEYGIAEDRLHWYKHEKLAHYASDAYDIEYKFKCMKDSFKEIEGIHARGDWDLSQHSKFSGVKLDYFDQITEERFVPHIMETSTGVARQFLMFLDSAYTEENLENGETRLVLKLDKRLAPVKVAVLPLMKKEELSLKAKEVYKKCKEILYNTYQGIVEYDESGSIGKRYRRQDEIGTPVCITIDYDTLKDGTVTVRYRDSMKQERVSVEEIQPYL